MTTLRLIVALVVAFLALPVVAQAQAPPGKTWRLGVLMSFYPPEAQPPQALRHALRDLGYIEGRNLVIERYAGGRDERMPNLAAELVRLNVDLIVTDITTTTRA